MRPVPAGAPLPLPSPPAGGRRWQAPRPSLRACLSVALVGAVAASVSAAALLLLPRAEDQGMEDARARVDRGLATIRRQVAPDGERAFRLADEAELLATRPALVEAFADRDLTAINDLLVQARSQFQGCPSGCTSAVAVVDENKMAIAEQPPRPLYDYNKSWVVRNALRPNQTVPFRPQRGVDARATPANPLADLGLFVAYPIVRDGVPVGAVVVLRIYNDALMQELADLSGLDVAVVKADALLAGSRDVRILFQPPRVRPPAQRLAPVDPVHQIGEQQFVAASEPIRSWTSIPALARPIPTPRGGLPGAEPPGPSASPSQPPIIATLFVGLKTDGLEAGTDRLRGLLIALFVGGAALAFAAAQGLGRAVQRPVAEVTAGLAAVAAGERALPARGGPVGEGAALAGAFNAMQDVTTARLRILDDERRKLEAVIHSVTQGIIVLDDRARLVTVNETAQRLLGLPPGLPPGTDLATVLTPGQWDTLRPAVVRREPMAAEVNLSEPRQAIVRVAAVPVHDDFARLLGRAVVLQDVTEERLLDNVKADFFTAMSHELRTPLSAIKGAAEVLLDDALAPTQRHFLETIHRNSERLSRLVTDLLDLSKLESGRTELRPSRTDLNEIVADAVAALEPVAEREGQRLTVRTQAETLPLTADPGRLEQIVTNLVSNALQYTPRGGEIVVSTWSEAAGEGPNGGAGGGYACLAVTDDGVGISTVDQQHLFDKFYQGVNALTHKRGGSGLGLAIVKQLTELHGGQVAVQSKLGQGSSFTVRLPLDHVSPHPTRPTPDTSSAAPEATPAPTTP